MPILLARRFWRALMLTTTVTAQEAPNGTDDDKHRHPVRASARRRWPRPGRPKATKRATNSTTKAIVAFRLILVNHPELIRVRLELVANAFSSRGRTGWCGDTSSSVLAGDGAAAGGGQHPRWFLNVMQARKRWTGYFGDRPSRLTAYLNAASESEIIYIDTVFGRWLPFQREGDFGAQSGFGVSVWGGGEYQQPLSERLRLLGRCRPGGDRSRVSGRNDFDQTFLAAHVGPRWLSGSEDTRSAFAGQPRSARWLWLGHPYADEFGARLELDRRLTPGIWARGTAESVMPPNAIMLGSAGFSRWSGGGFHRHLCVDAGKAGTARAHYGGLRARPCGVGALNATCRAGCGWEPRSPCRWASPWAPAPQMRRTYYDGSGRVELTRFRGYLILLGGGIHHATNTSRRYCRLSASAVRWWS